MSTLKDILNQIAKKANEEKEDKEKFLIRLNEQIINAAKEGYFRITCVRREYNSPGKILIPIPDSVRLKDIEEFFKDSELDFTSYRGFGGEEIEIDWGN